MVEYAHGQIIMEVVGRQIQVIYQRESQQGLMLGWDVV